MSPGPSDNSQPTSVNKSGYSATNGGEMRYAEASEANGVTEVVMMQSTEITQGPLPHPKILREYNDIIKDGAERIMAMAEKEQEARLRERELTGESNRKLAERKLNYFKRGQWMGFSLALIVLVSAALFAFYGFETLAGILLATTLVALVGLFVYTTKNQNKV